MYKRYIFCFIILFQQLQGRAQNLVPNPSFEQFNNCPQSYSEIAYSPLYNQFPTVQNWINPSGGTTSDYLNACAPVGNLASMNVPHNSLGYQLAHIGNGYAGIIPLSCANINDPSSFWNEYIECKLLQPLTAGAQYEVSFYVSFSYDTVTFGMTNVIAVDKIGAYLSNAILHSPTANFFTEQPQIESPAGQILSDTGQWIKISGLYTAQGGEQWLTIGRFYDGVSPVNHIQIYPSVHDPVFWDGNYMYIDDVSVVPYTGCDTTATRKDTLICDFKVNNITLTGKPASTYIWSTGESAASISISDTGIYWCAALDSCNLHIDTFEVKTPNVSAQAYDTAICVSTFSPVSLPSKRIGEKYTWSTGDIVNTIQIISPGTYWCKTLSSCNIYIDTFHVSVVQETYTSLTDTVVCYSDTMLLWLNLPDRNEESYLWNTGDTSKSLVVSKAGNYWRRSLRNCITYADTINVSYYPDIISTDLWDDTTICKEDKIIIGRNITGTVGYEWSTGETECCISPASTGNYVRIASNECTTIRDSITVTIVGCNDCLFVPTAFSPNGDGRNDEFNIIEKCPVKWYKLNVYDRWGELVFQTLQVGQGWNGAYKGENMPVGTYFYYITYTTLNDQSIQELKGDITLIR